MNAEHLLARASAVVAHRRGIYGAPDSLFQRVATRWSQVLGTRVTPAQVIICLLDLKVARLAHDPAHSDSLVDLIGYSLLLPELVGDASAEQTAEAAEGTAAAEALLKSAEARRSAGRREHGILNAPPEDGE
jgi:Domain of unknown function (DUF6378)